MSEWRTNLDSEEQVKESDPEKQGANYKRKNCRDELERTSMGDKKS